MQDWAALQRELAGLPQHPAGASHPRNILFRLKRGIDFVGHSRPVTARLLTALDPYPKPFRHVTFRAPDGVQLAGWLGPQHPTRPSAWGLVLVPGLFASKDDTAHKRRAIRIWRNWRIPVLAMDLRGFGESRGIGTAGWKEALDIEGAARFLKEREGLERVAVMAESLGGAAALNAAAADGASGEGLLAGGVLTWSAFVDAKDAVEYITAEPPEGSPFVQAYRVFRRLLVLKTQAYERFDEYLEDAARALGLSGLDELLELSTPRHRLQSIRAPTLMVHAMDDPVVPPRHVEAVRRYAMGNGQLQAVTVPWGGHTGFEPCDPHWYWEVARRFFGAVNATELPNLRRSRPAPVQAARKAAATAAGTAAPVQVPAAAAPAKALPAKDD